MWRETYKIKYLQSEVWFSDIDENLEDIVDDIVINEDIYNDIICDSGDGMTLELVYFSWNN